MGYYVYEHNPVFPQIWNACVLNTFAFIVMYAVSAAVVGIILAGVVAEKKCDVLFTEVEDVEKCEQGKKDNTIVVLALLLTSIPISIVILSRVVMSTLRTHWHFEAHPNERNTCNNIFVGYFTCLVKSPRRVYVKEEDDEDEEEEGDIVKYAKSDDDGSQSFA